MKVAVSFPKESADRVDRGCSQLRLLEANQMRIDLCEGHSARIGKMVDVVGDEDEGPAIVILERVLKSGAQIGSMRQVLGRPRMRLDPLLDEYVARITWVTSVMSKKTGPVAASATA